MSKSLDEIFKEKIQQVDTLYSKWADIQKKLLQLLNSDETDEINIVKDSDSKFMESIRQFSYEINNPKITLATTGTTSGGKSSLVNLLCGAEIMPVAVQEMSAGTVIINHRDIRSLTIPLVPGLPDEYSGTWTDISDIEIRQRLQKVMDGYRQLREENKEPPAPRIEIQYPTRLGSKPELIGLPSNSNLCIIDLPGFKHIADDHNRNIIRTSIKPALCLVTYNSEEPDPIKQQRLLDEVVEQVRDLRGTPSRMLFILNRIDVFRRDSDWKDQTDKFIDLRFASRSTRSRPKPLHEGIYGDR